MITATRFGASIDFPSLTDIRRTVKQAVADEAEGIGKEVIKRLKPEIPGLVKSATQAALDKLEPQIPRLVGEAVAAARARLALPKGVKGKAIAVGVAVGTLWLSSAVFSFLAWKKR